MEKKTEIGLGITLLLVLAVTILAGLGMYELASKFFGVLLIIFAAFLIIYFPDATEIQDTSFAKTAIVIGIILFFAGVFLIFF